MTKTFQENFELIYPDDRAGAFQSFLYDECLCDIKTKYQHIQLFQTKTLGKVLVLDGVVQCTELDEAIYHEMLVHVPMFTHPNPLSDGSARRVLIVGGGDGGSLREVMKHDMVEEVVICEIDKDVIEIAAPAFGNGDYFNDDRVRVVVDDAAHYLQSEKSKFDVIIIDSTDPTTEGGKSIYSRLFAASLSKRLAPHGVISMMSGVPMAQGLDHLKSFNEVMSFMGFKPELYTTAVPTYYGGLTAMYLYTQPHRSHLLGIPHGFETKHYNAEIHEAAFVLPNWLKEMADG